MSNVWFWLFITVLGRFSTAGPPTKSQLSLAEEYKDIIQLNKYAPAMREFVAKILKAITIFDCYDMKVREKKPFFNEGSEFSSSAFDALRWHKKSQTEYTKMITQCLMLLRDTEKAFIGMPDELTGIEDENEPCFMGGTSYSKEDCTDCKNSTPSFKTKKLAKVELRILILQMQEDIPKQFLFYASDIFVITAEAIRIIDKTYTCLEQNNTNCDTRDKVIAKFSQKMNGVVKKEKDHVNMVSQENVKMSSLVEQLKKQVQATSKVLSSCLEIKKQKNEEKKLKNRSPDRPASGDEYKMLKNEMEEIAKKYGLTFDKIEAQDSGRYSITLSRPKIKSIGTKIAQKLQGRR